MPLRVVIADDHPVVRGGLRALLESIGRYEVVGEASDGASALELVAEVLPDVALLDVGMPELDGIEVARRLRDVAPDVAVLMLTMSAEAETVRAALRAGARGYLLKGAEQEEIDRALQAVAAGEAIFAAEVVATVIGLADDPAPTFPDLTTREREVLDLVASGLRNAEIGTRLFLSPKTVANHLSSIFLKLGVADRSEAIVVARRAGLGEP